MIPRAAYWYWTGPPLPWLRAQSMTTFASHHPDWRLVLGSPDLERAPDGVELERDTVTSSALPPAARSDVWRYWALQRGGVYSDTDVLWVGSVDPLLAEPCDAWITQDGGTEGKRLGRAKLSIGVLAASEGSRFFRRAYELASRRPASPDYQSHGTRLLAPHWPGLTAGLHLGGLPFSAFYGGSSAHQVAALWRPGPIPAGRVGLHWYGGSPESKLFAGAQSAKDLPYCPVRRALA